MPEIWTIALTSEGIGACAMTPEMECRRFSAPWPEFYAGNTRALETAGIQRLLARALNTLYAESPDHELPLAIGICAQDEDTAVFVDRFGVCQSPVYLAAPLTMPRRAIPEKYASQELAWVYRNSVLRCLQQQQPLFGEGQCFGLMSLGALVAFWLSGHAVSSMLPRGVPVRFPVFEDENRERIFAALGIHPQYSMTSAKCGHVFARISPEIVKNLASWDMPQLAALAGVPVFDLGASEGAMAYACGANPLSWAANLGWQTQAYWTASITALAEFEIQIIDNPQNTESPENNAADGVTRRPEEMSADDWTMLWSRHLNLNMHSGPRQNLASYGYKLPSVQSGIVTQALQSLISDNGRIVFKRLKQVPLGSAGLHVWHNSQGWHITGLCPSHTPAHLARACFEGLVYDIRQKREALGYSVCGPLRLILSNPWPVECVQWAADILNTPVIWIDDSSCSQAAFGAAIALVRDLELQTNAKPRLEAVIIEPQERAAYYETHYQIHKQICLD